MAVLASKLIQMKMKRKIVNLDNHDLAAMACLQHAATWSHA
jgi:hypothetical protein